MRCPKCGREVLEGDDFCPGCGMSLRYRANSCIRCGSEVRTESAFCARCGMAVPARARPAEKLSKAFFLGSMVGGWILGYAMIIAAIAVRGPGLTVTLGFFSMLPLIYAAVAFFVLWYKAWAAIQDGYVRTTPGKAVGFLFIPFFNLYWLFQAIWGFARDYNSYIVRHRIAAPDLSEGFFLATCILSVFGLLLGWIPLIGYVVVIVDLVLVLVVLNAVLDGVNRLARSS